MSLQDMEYVTIKTRTDSGTGLTAQMGLVREWHVLVGIIWGRVRRPMAGQQSPKLLMSVRLTPDLHRSFSPTPPLLYFQKVSLRRA